ncbi:MAG TPA: disulfide bond formation protein B [Candidatus Paceibacterota bacterium]|jgi:disulfide bond formation protein DsbB|nr:disulfide bond formation protein B [Candidatus Paceibacterota bacterium]
MSFENVHYVNMFLGLGAILLQILSVLVLLMLVFWRKGNPILRFIKNNFLPIGFLITFGAVLTSFFYSDIMGYVPCIYCWWDRVLIFPQAAIFGIAWLRKDRNAFWYSLVLTVFGLYKSLQHLRLYYYGEGGAPCDASGVSCVQRLVSEFGGYISIPMLAFTGFFALATLLLVVHFYKKEN